MQKRDTLMHELTHAISDEMRLHLKEGQVHRVAMGWLSILRHNPDLVAFLTADDA